MHRTITKLLVIAVLAACFTISSVAMAKTTLNFLVWGDPVRLKPVLDDFHAKHPDIEVRMDSQGSNAYSLQEALVIRTLGGAPPDLTYTHFATHADVERQGLYADLTPYLERDAVDIYSTFPRGVVDFFTTQGRITGLPMQLSTHLLWYNKSLFDSHGLGYPTGDWRMTEELVDHARRLSRDQNGDGINDQWGLEVINAHINADHFWGTMKWTEDLRHSNLLDPKNVEAFTWVHDLYNNLNVSSPTINTYDAFTQGELGMIGGIQTVYSRLSGMTHDWDIEVWPTSPGGNVTYGSGAGIAMVAGAPNAEAAWTFLKYWMQPETQQIAMEIGFIPGGPGPLAAYFRDFDPANVGLNFTPNSFTNRRAIVDSFDRVVAQPSPPNSQAVSAVLREHMPKLKTGEASPRSILEAAHEQLEAVLNETWQKIDQQD